ncbi:MAG TPA: GntR family transcriptional regulator [Pyrinomonadaceae bacterium]|nr:GntR family transcriptional regulator [Pyrinomonadaceae bacterium]
MRLWLSKNSEVPLREQLVRQIMLGVTSDDLKPGQRLPSTRELARRFQIHSNTVSAAYRDLERRGWLEFRKGSGVYVRALSGDMAATLSAGLGLDGLISSFLILARAQGFSLAEIQERIKHWLESQPPDHFLVVEPDEGLREILMAEIEEATGFRVRGAGFEECSDEGRLAGAAVVAMYGQAEELRARLPEGTTPLLLHSRSVPESLEGRQPPAPDALVAVVSRWPAFLQWARVVLVAAGLDPATLSFRDAREDGWQKGIASSAFVITDTLTATRLPAGCDARVFRAIADASLDELRSFVGQFLTGTPADKVESPHEESTKV